MRGDLAFIYSLISAAAGNLNKVLCVDHREVDRANVFSAGIKKDVSVRTHTGVRIVSCLSFFGEPLLEMEESGRLYLEILAHSSH